MIHSLFTKFLLVHFFPLTYIYVCHHVLNSGATILVYTSLYWQTLRAMSAFLLLRLLQVHPVQYFQGNISKTAYVSHSPTSVTIFNLCQNETEFLWPEFKAIHNLDPDCQSSLIL